MYYYQNMILKITGEIFTISACVSAADHAAPSLYIPIFGKGKELISPKLLRAGADHYL
jgi:hypothetical protein